MAFVREKRRGSRRYYYLVENTRQQDGKVRQRTIRYIGIKRPKGPQKGLKGG